jgi:predicted polyphosphate/ATP-dependent NAD kinase
MQAVGVDLILFAGGDGTARDIFEVTGDALPLLGIPTGVKMQSGVFATSPEAAGDIASALVQTADRDRIHYRQSEVMDIDEAELRRGAIVPRLYGYARVPQVATLLQNAKARNRSLDEGALPAAAQQIADDMEPGTLYALGPGRSTQQVLQVLKLEGTLLGTDLVLDRKLVARDVDERTILHEAEGKPLRIVVGVIGGQGYVFGRGNQELSPAVIRRAGRAGITVLAAQAKLIALPERRLLIDTGDLALDLALAGYWRVMVGGQEYMMMKVAQA